MPAKLMGEDSGVRIPGLMGESVAASSREACSAVVLASPRSCDCSVRGRTAGT